MNQVVLFGDSEFLNPRTTSIYILASYLRKHGYNVQPIWAWFTISEIEFRGLCKRYISKETKVVGISTTLLLSHNNVRDFFGISDSVFKDRISYIKKLNPDIKIVVGGSKVRQMFQEDIPHIDLIDYVVKGQGESTLLWVLQNLDKPIDNKFISDAEIPYNDFNIDKVEFAEQDCIQPNEGGFIEFARGCIFKCSFCAYHLTGKKRNEYTKGIDVLKAELIENYEKYGVQYYNAVDDLINDSVEKVDDIYNMTQQLPFKIKFGGYVRLDLIWKYPTMAKQLKDAGLISTFFGIETINDKSGKAVRKGLGRERTDEALGICYDAWQKEVSVIGGFILGLPHDTPDTKYELMEWLNKPETRNVITEVYVGPLNIVPNSSISEIASDPAKFGYSYNTQSPSQLIQKRNPIQHADWVTKEYSYKQAFDDAKEVEQAFYDNTTMKFRFDPFNLPLFLSLSPHKQEIMNVILNDDTTFWKSNDEWEKYLKDLYSDFKRRYIRQILKLGKPALAQ